MGTVVGLSVWLLCASQPRDHQAVTLLRCSTPWAHHDHQVDDDDDGHDGTIGGNEEDDKDDCVPRDHFRDTVQVLPAPPHT